MIPPWWYWPSFQLLHLTLCFVCVCDSPTPVDVLRILSGRRPPLVIYWVVGLVREPAPLGATAVVEGSGAAWFTPSELR